MQNELISIIIPCYNVSQYLEDTFNSIAHQSYTNIEAIFVDDGSTDDTYEKVSSFCKRFKKAKIIRQQNYGLGIARNVAIKHAKGKYLYFYDSDDFFHPNALIHLYTLITQNNADVAIANFKKVKETSNYFEQKFNSLSLTKHKSYLGKDQNASQYLSSNIFNYAPWSKLFKHDIFKTLPFYPNVFIPECRFLEDVPVGLLYFSKCQKVVYSKEVIYYYRQRKSSLTHTSFDEKKLTLYSGWKYFEYLNKDEYPELQNYIKMKKCIDDIYILFLISRSNYCNQTLIAEIYNRFKNNLAYCFKSKRCQWYIKYLMWASKPFVYLMIRKKLH